MCFVEDTLIKQIPKLKSLAISFTNNIDDANDLLNETCLHILEQKHKLKETSNINGWFSVIMKNLFINKCRREKFIVSNNNDVENKLKTLYSSEESDSELLYNDLLNKIDTNSIYYKCFNYHLNGYKYYQISEMFNIPINTVRAYIFHYKQKMKYILTGKPNKYYPKFNKNIYSK